MAAPLSPKRYDASQSSSLYKDENQSKLLGKIREIFREHCVSLQVGPDGISFTAKELKDVPKLLAELSHLVQESADTGEIFSRCRFSTTSPNALTFSQEDKSLSVDEILGQAAHHCLASQLRTPTGQTISYEDFIHNPLFSYTKEKSEVYFKLLQLVQSPSFQQDYEALLQNLQKETWFEPYRQTPETLALLSLVAFLDGKISKWDLFTIHIIADAFHEEQKGVITNVHITLLNPDNAASFLESHHIPPFWTPSENDSLVRTDKTLDELSHLKNQLCQDLSHKTPLERSVVTYAFERKQEFSSSMEVNLYKNTSMRECFTDVVFENEDLSLPKPPPKHITTTLLPITLQTEIHRAQVTRPTRPLDEQHVIFGYGEDEVTNQIFAEGRRVFSIASPCFTLPYVHGCLEGPAGLGMTLHDIGYHHALEVSNFHLQTILDLYKNVINLIPSLPRQHQPLMRLFANHLLDREGLGYRYHAPPQLLFIKFLTLSLPLNKKWIVAQSLWCYEVLLPTLNKLLQDHPLWNEQTFIETAQVPEFLLPKEQLYDSLQTLIKSDINETWKHAHPNEHIHYIKWLVSHAPKQDQPEILVHLAIKGAYNYENQIKQLMLLLEDLGIAYQLSFLTEACILYLSLPITPENHTGINNLLTTLKETLITPPHLGPIQLYDLLEDFLTRAFEHEISLDFMEDFKHIVSLTPQDMQQKLLHILDTASRSLRKRKAEED